MDSKDGKIEVYQIMGKWIGGGVESVIMNYYENIDRSKIQFTFICDEDSTDIPYEKIEKLGGKVIIVPPYQKVFKYIKKLKEVFKEKNCKIVHSNINTLSVFPLYAAKKAGVPIRIAHSHSTSNKKEWKKNLIKNILRLFSKENANEYLACSRYAGIYLFGKRMVEKDQVKIINNAIDLNKYKFNNEIRNKLRNELNISNDTLVIGHIGRFVEQKNHDFLIDVFNEIHKENKDTILLLIGQGPLKEKIKIKVKELGLDKSVRFLGQVDNASDYYNAMDVFVLPSLYEGLPVVGVEAQANGLKCYLSTDMTKETKVLEKTEFVSLKLNAKEWSKKILKGLDKNKREEDTEKEMTEKGFNIKKESKKLEKIYQNIIADVIGE